MSAILSEYTRDECFEINREFVAAMCNETQIETRSTRSKRKRRRKVFAFLFKPIICIRMHIKIEVVRLHVCRLSGVWGLIILFSWRNQFYSNVTDCLRFQAVW